MKNGKKVFLLTLSFLLGTTLACLLIGMSLGAVSIMIPESITHWVEYLTAALIIILGLILIINPHLLHHHDHDHHEHDHDHHHNHDHHVTHVSTECGCHSATHSAGTLKSKWNSLKKNVSLWGMFLIGFFNMIIPCPTVSVMYKYAVDSGSVIKATLVFGIYAVATAIAVGGVIFAIHKTTNAFYMLQKAWIETAVMKTAGTITVVFGIWSIV